MQDSCFCFCFGSGVMDDTCLKFDCSGTFTKSFLFRKKIPQGTIHFPRSLPYPLICKSFSSEASIINSCQFSSLHCYLDWRPDSHWPVSSHATQTALQSHFNYIKSCITFKICNFLLQPIYAVFATILNSQWEMN